jgi:hypothetical protein
MNIASVFKVERHTVGTYTSYLPPRAMLAVINMQDSATYTIHAHLGRWY